METCNHEWQHKGGRSYCPLCGATAWDLRCFPNAKDSRGRWLTVEDVRKNYACPLCYAAIDMRTFEGELYIACTNGHLLNEMGKLIKKSSVPYRMAQDRDKLDKVMAKLPEHLKGEIQNAD